MALWKLRRAKTWIFKINFIQRKLRQIGFVIQRAYFQDQTSISWCCKPWLIVESRYPAHTKPSLRSFMASQNCSIRRRGGVWNESRDGVIYYVVNTSHENITIRCLHDVFTTSSWLFLFSFFYGCCFYNTSMRWDLLFTELRSI